MDWGLDQRVSDLCNKHLGEIVVLAKEGVDDVWGVLEFDGSNEIYSVYDPETEKSIPLAEAKEIYLTGVPNSAENLFERIDLLKRHPRGEYIKL